MHGMVHNFKNGVGTKSTNAREKKSIVTTVE